MIIYVDVDNTICQTNDMNYEKSIPIYKNIELINSYYKDENQIVYWTARGTKTGINHFKLTHTQLLKWGCKFNEVRMGKPNYDIFIDDKNLNSKLHFNKSNINKILSF